MRGSIEDAGPLHPIIGLRVEIRLEEHPHRKKFCTTIGSVSVATEPSFDGMYALKLDSSAAETLSAYHVLFLPQVYRFSEGFSSRKGRVQTGESRIEYRLRRSCLVAIRQSGRLRQSIDDKSREGIDGDNEPQIEIRVFPAIIPCNYSSSNSLQVDDEVGLQVHPFGNFREDHR